jgi:hypothetical protein
MHSGSTSSGQGQPERLAGGELNLPGEFYQRAPVRFLQDRGNTRLARLDLQG